MCSVNKTELPNQITEELRNIHVGCALTIAILGTLGNVISITLICKAGLFQASPIMMLIVDLCVSNTLSTAVILPIIAVSSIYRRWLFGAFLCKAFGYLMLVTLTAECLILVNLMVCQYLTIVHQVSIRAIFFNRQKHLRLFALVGLPWVLMMLVFLVPLTDTWDTFGYDYKTGYCSLIKKDSGIAYRTVFSICLLCVMTAVTFYCYFAILFIYVKSHRRLKRQQQVQAPYCQGRTKRVLLMISAVLANYVVTYLPIMVINTVDPCRERIPLPTFTVLVYVTWSHAVINPVLYALLNSRINFLWRASLASAAYAVFCKFTCSNALDELGRTEPAESLSTYTGQPTKPLSTYTGQPTEPLSTHTGQPTEPSSTHTGQPTEPLSTYTGQQVTS